jgi:hypothetical protein
MVQTRRRKQQGGGWGLNALGNGWTQFINSVTPQTNAQPNVPPNVPSNLPPMKAGNRRRKSVKRGGNAITQAVVPFSLLAMNNMLGSRKRRRKH